MRLIIALIVFQCGGHAHRAPATNDERGNERDDQLGQLCAEIEGYTLNTHVDILRASIARHQLRSTFLLIFSK